MLTFSASAYAQDIIVYQDDFEGSVSGWSNNDIDFDNDVTNFLGRFANAQTTTSRSFTVPAGSSALTIDFDLYRFDSWDTHLSDGFELDIDGTSFFFTFSSPSGTGSNGDISWSYSRTRGPENFAFNMGSDPWWQEQLFSFNVTVNNPGASVALTLTANLDQDGEDFPVTLNYPADGVLFLHAVIFDPSFQYGRPTLPDYTCPEADLVTVKTLADSTDSAPSVGDTVSFEITVTHNGDDQATNVTLTDSLPAGLTAVGGNGAVSGTGTSTGGSYDVATGLWTIGTLEDGETATLTLTGTVDAGEAGNVITNTLAAPAASDQIDPTADGDDLTESVTIDNLIEAISETFPAIDGTIGGATSSVLASDTINGAAVNPADITITVGSSAPELALDPNTGLITVAANTAAGTYTVTQTDAETL